MKMKRVKYIYVAMLLLGTTSCADMLDRFPLDSLAPETYYNNEMELKSATNNFYGMFPGAPVMGRAMILCACLLCRKRSSVHERSLLPVADGIGDICVI